MNKDETVRPKMTIAQLSMLEWLGEEESSALGECDGPDLSELFRRGLAVVTPPRVGIDNGFRRVSLTDAGRALLREASNVKG